MSEAPQVSVVIPCRNEEKFIGKCLDSIIANDYLADRLEVLVIDGMSEDGTRKIVEGFAKRYPFIRLVDNPKKGTSAALNIGLSNAKSQIIMRMDAHALYPTNYISALIDWLTKSNADNVGGVVLTLPSNDTPMANAIAIALSHPFGVGNSYFRIGTSATRWVDTVPFGCYRREVFDRIGQFDETLVRNQDDEFNLRLIKRGGRILLVPDIFSYYYARDSLRKLWRMYYQYGYFKPLVARRVKGIMTIRQMIPAAFVLSLLAAGVVAPWSIYARGLLGAIIASYIVVDLACSLFVSFRRELKCVLPLTVVFPVLHVSYGVGFMMGILDHVILKRTRKKDDAGISITR